MMLGILLCLAKRVDFKRFAFLAKIAGTDIKLAVVAFAFFGFTYIVLIKAIMALEFAQDPTAFVP